MGTGSGKPLRWMLRLSRHTGREHHSLRGERRKCLMFNQDSGPAPAIVPCAAVTPPIVAREQAAGGASPRPNPRKGSRRWRQEADQSQVRQPISYHSLLRRSSRLSPAPPSRHTTWAGGRTAPRSPLYLVIFPLSLGGRLLPPPRMGRLLQNKSFITVSAL